MSKVLDRMVPVATRQVAQRRLGWGDQVKATQPWWDGSDPVGEIVQENQQDYMVVEWDNGQKTTVHVQSLKPA